MRTAVLWIFCCFLIGVIVGAPVENARVWRGYGDAIPPEQLPVLLGLASQYFSNLGRLNTFRADDPFEPAYAVREFDTFPLNWYHQVPIWTLEPNSPGRTLQEEQYLNNYAVGNVAGAPVVNQGFGGSPFGGSPLGGTSGFGAGGIPFQPSVGALPFGAGRRKKRQTNQDNPEQAGQDLASAAASAGLGSPKFTNDELRRISDQLQRDKERQAEQAKKDAVDAEKRRVDEYLASLQGNRGNTNSGGSDASSEYKYNPACLRHFRGPFVHPQYVNGVFVDACNQPIPAEYILGARVDPDTEDVFGPLVRQQAGFDFLGQPIPQPEVQDRLIKKPSDIPSSDDALNNPDPFGAIPTERPPGSIDPLTGRERAVGVNARTLPRLLGAIAPAGTNPFGNVGRFQIPGANLGKR